MIDTEALRKKVIDLAIQGKLTEQLPSDGDAETLYVKIQEEKARLIKEGKIKKEKPLKPIESDEVPFEIPVNWIWARLTDISNIINGDRSKNYPAKSTLSSEGIPFISALNLNGKSVDDDDRLLCLSDEQYNKLGSGKLQKDDIVICIRGSLGKHGKYPFDKGAIASSLVICRPHIFADEIGGFIMNWLDSSLFPREIDKYDGGSAQPNLAAENLKKFLVPLPPIAEQKRINEKLEDILSQIDIIENLQQQYESDISVLKGKIIDAGIRGKLTEQQPEDGDAETLYSQIQEEKAKLIKEGKIKKEKPLPEIDPDEIPFEIPKNWKWVRAGDICIQITDGTHKTPTYVEEGIPFLSVKNISAGHFDLNDIKYIQLEEHRELIKRCNPERDDVLVCRIGTLGKAIRIDIDLEFSIFVSLGLIKTMDRTISDYIVSVINSDYGTHWIDENKAGGAMHTYKINLGALSLLPVPLPPYSEQKRISSKLNELLELIT